MSANRNAYWRSLEQLADTPEYREFLHREFPVAASELPGGDVLEGTGREAGAVNGFSRRRWIQLMGASLALGGMAGCRWESDEILPFVDRPEGRVPGKTEHYASAWELNGVGRPLVSWTNDGRPTKLEGNPSHPFTRGGTDVFDQAVLLGMYDPDRIDGINRGAQARTWREVEAAFAQLRDANSGDGAGLRVVSEPSSSLVLDGLKQRFAEEFPNAKWVEYSPASDAAERVGLQAVAGQAVRPLYDFSKADVVVSFDADVLGCHPGASGYIRDWASRRTPETGKMNRTYVVESQFSGTGSSADHRVAVRSSDIASVVAEVAAAVGGGSVEAGETVRSRVVAAMVEDLNAANGRSVVCCGLHLPAEVHAAVARLNEKLGNVGETVRYIPASDRGDDFAAIAELAEELRGGRVETLVCLGGNPLFDAPADVNFPAAMAAAKNVIRLSLYEDETSLAALEGDGWLLPQTHAVEQWDVLRAYDGSILSQQPLMPVVLNGRSVNEVVGMLVGDERSAREMYTDALAEAGVEGDALEAVLERGFVEDSAAEAVDVSFGEAGGEDAAAGAGEGFEVVVQVSPTVYDGRFANNGWLQETPQPMTKVVWDNAALLAPATAKELGVGQEDTIRITVGDASVTLPVFLMPGHAENSVTVNMGYGRTAAGRVGSGSAEATQWSLTQERLSDGPVGVDVTPLRSVGSPYVITGAEVAAAGGTYELATTQDHFAIDEMGLEGIAGRVDDLVREGNLEQWEEHPDFAQHQVHLPPLESLWNEWDYENRAWGMAIDMAKCVGCNSCVTACVSENNIPVVGKGQVKRGREMHWIRLDRYFAATKDDETGEMRMDTIRAVHQPVTCQQCENAPCEQVCPVAATVHSAEGLNDMVYNRCIGTRYCANNCPYKVRRFNFFNYNKVYDYEGEPGAGSDGKGGYDLQAMILNPEVTVRSRGVMEKCTYCVQRIKGVTLYAKNERRAIQDGEIVTACQAACPADAIVFGDLHDKSSRVAKEQAKPRAYAMLAELNTKPRTQYLARIRNPHPSLMDLMPESYKAEGHHGSDTDHGPSEHDPAPHGDTGHADPANTGEKEHAEAAH